MWEGKSKFLFLVIVVAFALGYLVYGGVRDSMVYYITVEELLDRTPEMFNKRVRVSGVVVPGSIKKKEDGTLSFKVSEDSHTIDVVYKGIVPDIFGDEAKAIVEGEYSKDGVFYADVLLAKCPTKYESKEQADKGKYQGVGASDG